MKKILLAMTAIGALAVAAPATAQYGSQASVNAGGGIGITNRIAQLDARLQAGIRSGEIDRREARSLRMQIRQLTRLEAQYSANGLSRDERRDLQQRIRTLREQMRLADNNSWDRNERYGGWDNDNWDDDGRYADRVDRNRDGWDDRDYDRDGRWDDDVSSDGRYATRIDRNRDGWDDRDYDRDGRWDEDEVYGQGGPYEEVACETRGGIGGVLESVLGVGGNCGLRVGQRVSGNLGSVPYEYRNQYRDGNGVYYRSDGRQIYQIDARTQTVVRIYPMNR
jgi:hypothetical protein